MPHILTYSLCLRRDQLVANRIRRIRIFSNFSVPAEPRCGLFTRDPDYFQEKFNNTLIRLEELQRLINRKGIPSNVPDKVALSLLDSVPNTSDPLLLSVRELVITSGARNKFFSNLVGFMKILWGRHIGESLIKLEVAASTVDTLLLITPTNRYLNRTVSSESSDDKSDASSSVKASRNPHPCKITHLSIHFITDFDTTCTGSDVINKYLSQLIQPLTSTLSSFSLSYATYPCADKIVDFLDLGNPNQQDFSEVLEALPYLPALKEVKFQAPFTPKTMKNPGALTEWLRAHQDQLEQLTIRATNLLSLECDNPGVMYSNWLTRVGESRYRGFPSLTFALLRSLEIRTGCKTRPGQRVIPSLKGILPSLRSLTIGYDEWLVQRDVEDVLKGCSELETFRLRYIQLVPELLDLLHEKLPRLKVLVMDCRSHMVGENHIQHKPLSLTTRCGSC